MEHVGRMQDVIHFSLHSKLYNHKDNAHLTQTRAFPGVSEGFHLYSIDWEEDRIAFLFDGEVAAEWRNGGDGRDPGPDGWPFNAPFFLLLNVAFGGNFGGPPDEGCLPQTMEIKYVRVYQS
jgi:beta-glucanase (GH16 family)